MLRLHSELSEESDEEVNESRKANPSDLNTDKMTCDVSGALAEVQAQKWVSIRNMWTWNNPDKGEVKLSVVV